MALPLIVPAGCVRLQRAHVSGLHRLTTSASPSSIPRGGEAVDWVKETSSFFEQDSRPIMLFDGVCNLCNGGVKFVRDNDRQRRIRFEALQSEAGKKLLKRSGRAPDDISSVVLVEEDRAYIKSEAVLKIMEYIDFPFPQLAFFLQFVPLFVRDFVYENVADNRYTIFGRSESSDSEERRTLVTLQGCWSKHSLCRCRCWSAFWLWKIAACSIGQEIWIWWWWLI